MCDSSKVRRGQILKTTRSIKDEAQVEAFDLKFEEFLQLTQKTRPSFCPD